MIVPEPPRVVLDTNVVLDWLLFRDPRVDRLRSAMDAGALRWVTCARMREEFRRTLGLPLLARWKPDSERMLTWFDRYAVPLPDPAPAAWRLRCDDADDQVFVDLALASGARWLISHDKALLRLRRRMLPAGPLVCTPSEWTVLQEKGRPEPPC